MLIRRILHGRDASVDATKTSLVQQKDSNPGFVLKPSSVLTTSAGRDDEGATMKGDEQTSGDRGGTDCLNVVLVLSSL